MKAKKLDIQIKYPLIDEIDCQLLIWIERELKCRIEIKIWALTEMGIWNKIKSQLMGDIE